MNWLLRALGLARKPDLTDDQRQVLAEAQKREELLQKLAADIERRRARDGMGLEVLRGMSPGKAAKKHGCAHATALRAAERELERTPGYDKSAYWEFCDQPGKHWFSRARNMREFYAHLTSQQAKP